MAKVGSLVIVFPSGLVLKKTDLKENFNTCQISKANQLFVHICAHSEHKLHKSKI